MPVACARVERAVVAVEGVLAVHGNLATNQVSVMVDPQRVTAAEIQQARPRPVISPAVGGSRSTRLSRWCYGNGGAVHLAAAVLRFAGIAAVAVARAPLRVCNVAQWSPWMQLLLATSCKPMLAGRTSAVRGND